MNEYLARNGGSSRAGCDVSVLDTLLESRKDCSNRCSGVAPGTTTWPPPWPGTGPVSPGWAGQGCEDSQRQCGVAPSRLTDPAQRGNGVVSGTAYLPSGPELDSSDYSGSVYGLNPSIPLQLEPPANPMTGSVSDGLAASLAYNVGLEPDVSGQCCPPGMDCKLVPGPVLAISFTDHSVSF